MFYSNFKKSEIAALCEPISQAAYSGDALCKWIFENAGMYLAKHIQAVYNSADEVGLETFRRFTLNDNFCIEVNVPEQVR